MNLTDQEIDEWCTGRPDSPTTRKGVYMALEIKRHREMLNRLEEWALQLDAGRNNPGDVGHFIAAELRKRIKGDTK